MAWASLQYGSLRRVELFTQSLGSLTAGSSEKRRSCLAFYDPDSEVISITSVTLYCWMQSDAHLDSRGGASTPPLYGRRSGSHCIECNRRHCALILRMYSCLHTNTHTESTSTLSLWSSHCTINSGNFMALTLTKRHCHSPLLV